MRSVYDGVKVVNAVRPTTITGTGTPVAAAVAEIDTFGYNSALVDVAVGSPTGTAISFVVTLQVQESATSGSGFADAAGLTGTITGTTTTATLRAQIRIEGLGTDRKRYLKITPLVTMTPNSASVIPISAVAALGRAFKEAVGNSASSSF